MAKSLDGFLDAIAPGAHVGLIDADLVDGGTRHPNLALMKLSGYCKSHGCQVTLLESYAALDTYQLVFISKVFTFTTTPPGIQDHTNVHVGGTGFFPDGGPSLPYEIEHHKPDYDLYLDFVNQRIREGRPRSWFADYLDYSIGFTTRGCFRKCSFCVNKKYDHVFKHSPVSEFLDEARPYIYLWDDNFLGYPKWEEILDELEATRKPYQFRQGLDIRLLNDRKAKRLAKARYTGDFIFAFDHIEERADIERGLRHWRRHTVRGTRLYVLCAFDSQDETDIEHTFERIKILMRFGCLPYIMRYESYKQSRWRRLYVTLARWCNQPQFFKKKSFRQFCEANQHYHKNKKTKCSALQAMDEFEAAFPDVAARYFDLRFEEENMLLRHGRKFFLRPSDELSSRQRGAWQLLKDGKLSETDVLKLYYDKDLDIVWAQRFSGQDLTPEIIQVFDVIRKHGIDDIFQTIADSDYRESITPENIPQFSSIDDVCACAYPLKLTDDDELVPFDIMGMYLQPDQKKVASAHKKYGENHGKTASLLDLAYVDKAGGRAGFHGTRFDRVFDELDREGRLSMVAKLSLRIPIVRQALVDARRGRVVLGDYLDILSTTTQLRRRPNICKLFDLIVTEAGPGATITVTAGNVWREL